ncbi:hypothetical protein [Dongia sp.]|uniref:hypothetical protein n=1 Tax=Dongia sp. TaxID=1977262 RepID=UPI0035B039D2
MIKIGDDGSWRKDVGAEIRRLEILLFDLNVLHSGAGYPPREELARAQILQNPVIQPRSVPSLVGGVEIEGRKKVRQTSPIVLMGDGWVRTMNTLYRLEGR